MSLVKIVVDELPVTRIGLCMSEKTPLIHKILRNSALLFEISLEFTSILKSSIT